MPSVLTCLACAGWLASGEVPQYEKQDTLRLVGRVQDELRRPIADVEVILNRRDVRATTNLKGIFSILVASGDSTIGFRRIGYRPMLLSLRPIPSARDTILVELVGSQVQLPELIVSAPPSKPLRYAGTTKYDEVFQRQKIGFGSLINRETIDQRFGSSTAELLQGIPGVKVSNGPPKSVRFARCIDPGGITVFIDGARQIPNSSANTDPGRRPTATSNPTLKSRPSFNETPVVEMLSRVDPSQIEMIEVFRGASEIPGVFHWNGCAVIAVWTKWNR